MWLYSLLTTSQPEGNIVLVWKKAQRLPMDINFIFIKSLAGSLHQIFFLLFQFSYYTLEIEVLSEYQRESCWKRGIFFLQVIVRFRYAGDYSL